MYRHRIAYVSPQFPALSAVFEQNEILGLIDQCEKLILYSCRNVSNKQSELHDFAKPIQSVSRYFSVGQLVFGSFFFLFRNPLRFIKVLTRYIVGTVTQPSRCIRHTATFLLAICFAYDGRKENYTWVHADFAQASATVAWYLATLLGLPFSFKAHAFDIYLHESSNRERDSFFRAKLKMTNKIFVVHRFGLNLLINGYRNCGVLDKGVINRVSIRPISAATTALKQKNNKTFTIIALGRLTEKKGFDVLIESLRDVVSPVDWICEIWGSGVQEELLKKDVTDLGLAGRITFMGAYDQKVLPDIMTRADLLVVPSKKAKDGDMDGIPTVIFEAMLFHVPVLSTRLSGIPEVIEHGKTGWLVDPDNPGAITDIIEYLMGNSSVLTDTVARAYDYVVSEHDNYKLARDLIAEMK